MGFVTKEELLKKVDSIKNNEYYDYVRNMLNREGEKI